MNQYKPEGALAISVQNNEYISSQRGLERALEGQIILEAPAIMCDHELNLHVALGERIRGIIPREEAVLAIGEEPKDIAILTRVGKSVCFVVTGFTRSASGEVIALLSRRRAQLECTERYICTLTPGDVIAARVTHLESFGAFVDIGCGIISLLSIDSVSVSRIAHPSARLRVGEFISVVVKSIDDRGRIYVSTRELLGTWEENAALFKEGETVRGTVRSVEDYGIFVELKPNLAGLAEYKDGVKVGELAAVYIKSIIPEKMKIKLIIIDSHAAESERVGLEYFIRGDECQHISHWCYSPAASRRVIETIF